MATIGIDLGTTYSCVVSHHHGRNLSILNNYGQLLTPSVVAFTEDEILVGSPAVDQCENNVQNTVYDTKLLIGRLSEDSDIKQLCERFPFHVSLSKKYPELHVEFRGQSRTIQPEQIAAYILSALKADAENVMQENAIGTIVTVPTSFHHVQRNATLKACQLAGFESVHLLNEPTAAALYFGLDTDLPNGSNVLVYDLGGGTFDLCILRICDSIFDVVKHCGVCQLGGREFDERLMQYVREQFEQLHNCDLKNNQSAIVRLRTACERVKFRLSISSEANIRLYNFMDNICLSQKVTRAMFEQLNEDLFQRTISIMRDLFNELQLNVTDIDEVILVGGSTRIPRIKHLVGNFFEGKKINCSVDPDMTIATGAALYATKVLESNPLSQVSDFTIREVNQQPFGIVDSDNHMVTLIEANTILPAEGIHYGTTTTDHQTELYIGIYEGHSSMTCNNKLLAEYYFTEVASAPAGHVTARIHFHLNVDGILKVTITNLLTGKAISCVTHASWNHVNNEEKQSVKIAMEQTNREKCLQQLSRARLRLLLRTVSKQNANHPVIRTLCGRISRWLDENPETTGTAVETKFKQLQDAINICELSVKSHR